MLCSFVNPKFKQLLLEKDGENELFFPDIPYKYLKQFINDVYTGLCSSEFVLDINQDLAEVLGMLDGTTYKSENSKINNNRHLSPPGSENPQRK